VPSDADVEGSHGRRRIDGLTSERLVGADRCAATQLFDCP
jgi:hypothetical protein